MEKTFISWQEMHEDVKILCEKIKKQGKFDRIVAVSRGGLVPAGVMAYELNIRHVDTINIASYDGNERRGEAEVLVDIRLDDMDEKTLIVDDLVDSGWTFEVLKERFPKALRVCVYAKDKGAGMADICGKMMEDKWIVFPWD